MSFMKYPWVFLSVSLLTVAMSLAAKDLTELMEQREYKAKDPLKVVTDAIATKKPIILEFYNPPCARCKQLKPALEKIAQEFEGRITVITVNIDQFSQFINHYKLKGHGLPLLIYFNNGEQVGLDEKKALSADLLRLHIAKHFDSK